MFRRGFSLLVAETGHVVSEGVASAAAHPLSQAALIAFCALWWALHLPTDVLTATLSILAITLTQMVLNRQKLTWLNFVRAVTTPNAPLVMFLDDMQWADTATLLILQTLLTDVERNQLLVIAAYRDNETPPEHPLWKLVDAVDRSGAKVSRMNLTCSSLTLPSLKVSERAVLMPSTATPGSSMKGHRVSSMKRR